MGSMRRSRDFQNLVAATVLALGPGAYVAITLLGAGGGQRTAVQMANVANSTLYGTFVCFCLVCGALVNKFGPRVTLTVASLGYPIYIATLWIYQAYGSFAVPIAGAAVLGCCGALLWTSATFISYAYADETRKGRFIAVQWGMVNLASTMANGAALGLTFDSEPSQASVSVYAAFISVTAVAAVIATLGLVPEKDVQPLIIREAGALSFLGELKATISCLEDVNLLLLTIPSFASEISTVIVSNVNGSYFDIRTRSLNSTIYTAVQCVTCMLLALVLDRQDLGCAKRHKLFAVAVVTLSTASSWIALLVWQIRYADAVGLQGWCSPGFVLACVSIALHGANLSLYQVVTQYLVSRACKNRKSVAWYSAITRAAISAGMLFAFTTAAGGLSMIVLISVYFAVQVTGIGALIVVAVK